MNKGVLYDSTYGVRKDPVTGNWYETNATAWLTDPKYEKHPVIPDYTLNSEKQGHAYCIAVENALMNCKDALNNPEAVDSDEPAKFFNSRHYDMCFAKAFSSIDGSGDWRAWAKPANITPEHALDTTHAAPAKEPLAM